MKKLHVRVLFPLVIVLITAFSHPFNLMVEAVPPSCAPISATNIAQLIPIQRLPDQKSVKAIQFSPDNEMLTSVQDERFAEKAQQWDLAAARKRSEVSLGTSDNPVYKISPDGRYVAQGTAVVNGVLPMPATLYDMNMGRAIYSSTFTGYPTLFLMDKKTVVFVANGGNNSIYTFQWDTLREQQLVDLQGDQYPLPDKIVTGLAHDLRWVVTVGIDGDYHSIGPLQLWETSPMRERRDIYQDRGDTPLFDGFGRAAFSPDSRYLIVAGQNVTHLIDLQQSKQTVELDATATMAHDISYSPDSRYAVLSGAYPNSPGAKVSILELATGKIVATLPPSVQPLLFSPDGKLLLFGDYKNTYFWDLQQQSERIVLPFSVYSDFGWTGLFTADNSLCVFC